ncbi:MAG TPA: phosphate acyltransferase PlsX [Acidimicrobiia bacterium]|jgi:glycerol-3-phosphate acyltransferase PlsX
MSVTVAIDAMGGDHAPGAIVEGACAAVDEHGVRVLLVGREDVVAPLLGPGRDGIEVVGASEVVAMDDAATSVRSKKDSSIVVAAQLVRDGKADAMVSAGNTGATMAAALLRMGRIKGVARPAIAVLVPVPGHHPQILVDGGSTIDCTPEWLLQFALMGREYARTNLGVREPRVGLLSNGEEAGKGDELRKETRSRLEGVPGFVGNVEGRDFMRPGVDVVVTDGFTGNVALKSLEGAIRATASLVFEVLARPELAEASSAVMPHLLDAAKQLDPDHVGGAVLLGVAGVCIVAHGSSSPTAVVGAVRQAVDAVDAGVVDRTREAIAGAR